MSRLGTWWAGRSRGQRALAVIAVAIVALGTLRLTIDSVAGTSPGGPVSSSYSTGGSGLEGYADLLREAGHPVTRLRDTPEAADLPSGSTVVVTDPDRLRPATARLLAEFVGRGGRVVVTGAASAPLVSAAAGSEVGHTDEGGASARVWVPSPDTGSARRLEGDDGGRWTSAGALVPLAGDDRGPLVVAGPVGEGHVVAVADTSVLHNRNLARADNAALGLALVGEPGRPVVFLESLHGFEASGLDALPDSWTAAFAVLGLAVVIGLWAFGRRFGPPEPQQRELRPPRRDHVEAVASALDQAGADTFPSDHHPPGASP